MQNKINSHSNDEMRDVLVHVLYEDVQTIPTKLIAFVVKFFSFGMFLSNVQAHQRSLVAIDGSVAQNAGDQIWYMA